MPSTLPRRFYRHYDRVAKGYIKRWASNCGMYIITKDGAAVLVQQRWKIDYKRLTRQMQLI